jgi:hypothetical protein
VNICLLGGGGGGGGGVALHSGTDLCQSLFCMFCDPRSIFSALHIVQERREQYVLFSMVDYVFFNHFTSART